MNFKKFLLFFYLFLFFVSEAYATQIEKIAVFPFENFTEDKNAESVIMPVLKQKLKDKGYEILDDNVLNKFFLKERIRTTGYISKDIAKKIKEEFNVDAILLGSINSFSKNNLQVGISAYVVNPSDSTIIWADHASASAEDFVKILGLGKIETIQELTSKVLDRLIKSFDKVPAFKEKELTYKIAVMPFKNKSKIKKAGQIVTYMFIEELFKNKNFEPVNYGEIKKAIIDLRIRKKEQLDFKTIKSISDYLGVDGIIIGTVESYNEQEGNFPPQVTITARLIDVRRNRILWCDSYQYKGDDGIFIFDWGKITTAENVGYKVVSKLLNKMSKIEW